MANRLINEQSPYLLQHAHNPVDWYPWGDEAFVRAKNENKPVLVSIGYAACHWCHVMERESFESEEVAAYMNEHFINIKVDREEHPDVDHLYMDAVQAISGSGGWPLNVFVTPDRVPFYGGTYFPPRPAYSRPSWRQLLQRMLEVWTDKPEEVTAQGQQMIQYLKQASSVGFAARGQDWDMDTCRTIADALLQQADTEWGGFGRAPKFPGTMAISYLLEHYHYTKYEPALSQAMLSLDRMIEGGIYDQLGGGFARYSTDEKWLAPHFEKMLYDNALLVSTLCDAYYVTKRKRYKEVIEETIAFVERELKDPSGGYYSALDADSEGEEGKFYTWTWDEWKEVIGDDELLQKHFGVVEEGNWEHTNILHVAMDIQTLAKETNYFRDELETRIAEARQKLFVAREKKIRPLTDDKCLLSWNALINTALSKAGAALGNSQYIQRAEEHMRWMLDVFLKDGVLLHTWKQDVARIPAKLDDYAYLIQALLQLTSATGDEQWIVRANGLMEVVIRDFAHETGSFFYYSSAAQTDIPVRKVDLYDGATPSANSVMAHNMLWLGVYMERSEWLEQAHHMLRQMSSTASRYAYSFAYWAQLLQRYSQGLKTVICTGVDADKSLELLNEHFLPHASFVASKKEISDVPLVKLKFFSGQSRIFVCTHYECLPPVADVARTLDLLGL
ncbi:thioredoxin domain-containing protein [Polluticoccus soli]|uniref:thioredoxin domain-containing protein n=1 Tax=Polluticoccus soli TaxID=3034150 RepID=UPI0023E16C8D|nr:thioredoxin domain-containing protein [Flavipsychrobacter sp. JY13-12]